MRAIYGCRVRSLARLVPAVALTANLAGASGAAAAPAAFAITDDDVAAAAAGLDAYLAANRPASPADVASLDDCPVVGLDALARQVAAAGFADELHGWGATVEWGEYAEIGPSVLGVTCRASAGGDPADGTDELAVSVLAVDIGSATNLPELLNLVGYGATESEPAGVPGGHVDSACVDETGLGVCLSFWSSGGLVLGTTIWSETQEVPEGSARDVLVATLPVMLDSLAAATPGLVEPGEASADEPAEPGVPAARAGLDRILSSRPDTGPDEPRAACSLAGVETFNTALDTAGIDAPLAAFEQQIAPLDGGEARSLSCSGTFVGATGDPSFPELAATLFVADVGRAAGFDAYVDAAVAAAADAQPLTAPAAGGETVGACADVDRTTRCIELWHDDGLLVGIVLADRVSMDRPTASAVLDQLVPTVIVSLSGGAADIADALASITDDAVLDAAIGFAGFVASTPQGSSVACPAISATAMSAALADAEIVSDLAGWAGTLEPVTYPDLDPAPLLLACADRDDLATLSVIDFANAQVADEFVASVGRPDGGSPADIEPGDLTVGTCATADDPAGPLDYCQEWWRRDGLVIGVTLFGPGDAIGPTDAASVLIALVPDVLATLASLDRAD